MTPVVDLEAIARTYRVGPAAIGALRDISVRVWPGEFVAITGPSGSGKSTLLNLLGLLDRANTGVYRLDGRDVASASDDELTVLRNHKVGFVFQSSPMLPRLTATENVAVPLVYRGMSPRDAHAQANRMLSQLGIGSIGSHAPSQLSGGQLQRVAIARALVGRPRLILADEPTASLDEQTANEVMTLMLEFSREANAALILITHEPEDARRADRHFVLDAGHLKPATPTEPKPSPSAGTFMSVKKSP